MLQIPSNELATSRTKPHRVETSLYAHPYARPGSCTGTVTCTGELAGDWQSAQGMLFFYTADE